MKIGIIGTSDIAFRRFLPALIKCGDFEYFGVASRNITNTKQFIDAFGSNGYDSYDALLSNTDVDCIYIPLPPALHYEWALKALEYGKHVLLEKPFTTSLTDTSHLIRMAQRNKLALHENYMFQYHSQLDWIHSKLPELGELRLIRLDFGFPFRGTDDFRYSNHLGGGALLDCGGYPLKLAVLLLGETVMLVDASLGYKPSYDVDLFGSATLRNDEGLTAQVSFGMDNSYRCSLDIWGSKGSLHTNRIFTAPDGFKPNIQIETSDGLTDYKLDADDCFMKSIGRFAQCICDDEQRENNYRAIIKQAEIIEKFKEQNA